MNPGNLKQLEWEISNLGVLLSIPLFSGVVHSYPFTVLSLMPYHTFVIQPFVTKPSLIKNLVSLLNHESFTCWQWLTRNKCQNISERGFKCPISAQKWRLIYEHVQLCRGLRDKEGAHNRLGQDRTIYHWYNKRW